jgi:hypothetical protein
MTVITEEFLALGRSTAGGWTKAQLALLGVPWPPIAGWKATILGQGITDAAAFAFVAGKKLPPAQPN